MLNQEQQKALDDFLTFLVNPDEEVFILEGPAGTGKSFLVQHILDAIPAQTRSLKLINPNYTGYHIAVTATTNKAVDALRSFVEDVCTIHSFLGLRVDTNIKDGSTSLVEKRGLQVIEKALIFIDEASFIDSHLLNLIFKKTKDCKYVFIGDPYQLAPVKYNHCPAFNVPGMRAILTEIVRNKGNQIEQVSKLLKQAVITGELEKFVPDNKAMYLLSEEEFLEEIKKEFTKPDWDESKAKIITWTNKASIHYGQYVTSLFNGSPHFVKGNYATVNKFISREGVNYSTDQTVLISDINPHVLYGIPGHMVEINQCNLFFLPDDWKEANKKIKQLRNEELYGDLTFIERNWIDLRPAPSCTINKSQGSTYDKVFIDYDDVIRCRQRDQLYRLLYVAVSRAKTHVYFKRGT